VNPLDFEEGHTDRLGSRLELTILRGQRQAEPGE
jgi:hypothetical protein